MAVSILVGGAITNYSMKNTFGSYFEFGEIMAKIRGKNNYFMAWLFALVAGFIAGIISGVLGVIPFLGLDHRPVLCTSCSPWSTATSSASTPRTRTACPGRPRWPAATWRRPLPPAPPARQPPMQPAPPAPAAPPAPPYQPAPPAQPAPQAPRHPPHLRRLPHRPLLRHPRASRASNPTARHRPKREARDLRSRASLPGEHPPRETASKGCYDRPMTRHRSLQRHHARPTREPGRVAQRGEPTAARAIEGPGAPGRGTPSRPAARSATPGVGAVVLRILAGALLSAAVVTAPYAFGSLAEALRLVAAGRPDAALRPRRFVKLWTDGVLLLAGIGAYAVPGALIFGVPLAWLSYVGHTGGGSSTAALWGALIVYLLAASWFAVAAACDFAAVRRFGRMFDISELNARLTSRRGWSRAWLRCVLAEWIGLGMGVALMANAQTPATAALSLSAAFAIVFFATVPAVAALVPVTREAYGLLACVPGASVPDSPAHVAAHLSTRPRETGSSRAVEVGTR